MAGFYERMECRWSEMSLRQKQDDPTTELGCHGDKTWQAPPMGLAL